MAHPPARALPHGSDTAGSGAVTEVELETCSWGLWYLAVSWLQSSGGLTIHLEVGLGG